MNSKKGKTNSKQSPQNKELERLAIKTHFVNRGESYIDLISRYVTPIYSQDDILFISEKVVSLCQNNVVEKKNVKLGFWAKFLSKFASVSSRGSGMDEPYRLQLAINVAGLPRILLACFCSAITKLLGKRGVFYTVAGNGIREMDGFERVTAFDLYREIAILAPLQPNEVCNEIYEKCNVNAVIVDVNDVGVNILGCSDNLKNFKTAELVSFIKDNPAGQDDELTPFVLVRQPKTQFIMLMG